MEISEGMYRQEKDHVVRKLRQMASELNIAADAMVRAPYPITAESLLDSLRTLIRQVDKVDMLYQVLEEEQRWKHEHMIIELSDMGVLTPEVLDGIATEWKRTNIDRVGHLGLWNKNGRDIEEVCVDLLIPNFAGSPQSEDDDAYENQFKLIARERWGWISYGR